MIIAKLKLGGVLFAAGLLSQTAIAATTALIDLKTQKFIGGVSDLDRSKYFNIHMTATENKVTAAELNYLVNDLNVGFGRQFWSPFSAHSGDAPYPNESYAISNGPSNISYTKNHANYPYFSNRVIVTEHPSKAFVFNEDPNLAAQWAVDYFKHYYDNSIRPVFYEPLNEPFVHAGDFSADQGAVRSQMTAFFKAIGQKFDQNNIATQVIGYSSAWPSMELYDFGHFNGRMKMFMDEAGPHIDSFSFHPYDGVNVTGASNERSGSNLESLLDMVETYSQFKWNTVKPITISEYGGIEEGYGDTYTDLRSAQSVASQNKMLMQLLNRQDRLLTSIPFNTGKAAWHYNAANNWNPYGATVLRPDPNSIVNGEPTNFFWTKRLDFYKLWSDVKGKRVKVESDNPDIQLNAFVDGNKAYVAVNTLADYWETVNLDFVNSLGTVTQVRQKRVVVRKNSAPTYEDVIVSAPSSHPMEPGETVVWEYTFSAPISFDNTYDTNHYYAPEHLVSINAGETNTFTFNGVNVTGGTSVLRMSIGRAHGTSFQPTITVNGQPVQINLNWAGGSQASRTEFFGVIEIPVDNSLLNANNTVALTFPDTGGRVASLVLQVNNDSEVSTVNEGVTFSNVITALPSGTSYDVAIDYTAGASRDIVVEFWQNNSWLGGKTVTVAAGTGQKVITVNSSKSTLHGETGYLFKTSIRPVGGNWQSAIEYVQSGNIVIDDNSVITVPTTYTSLQFKSNSKCLDNTAGGVNDGNQQQIWSCYSNANQMYILDDLSAGFYAIRNQATNKCLDKTNSLNPGAIVHQWTCDATNDNQSFQLVADGMGAFQLKNKHSGLCLSVVGGGTASLNGTKVEQATCASVDAQKLTFY